MDLLKYIELNYTYKCVLKGAYSLYLVISRRRSISIKRTIYRYTKVTTYDMHNDRGLPFFAPF